MNTKRIQSALIIIILCLTCIRGLIYGFIIPFDQSPDEKHHFQLIKAKQLAFENRYASDQGDIAAQIEHTVYYLIYPESPRELTVSDFEGARLPGPPSSLHLYYLLNALGLKIFPFGSIRAEIYALRAGSALLGTLVVFLAFLITREIFPKNRAMLFGVPVLVMFIPQLSYMNGSINNDKLAEVFLALSFFSLIKILKPPAEKWYFLAFVATLFCAILSKRTAVFALPLLLVLLIVYFWKTSLGVSLHLVLVGVFVGMAALGYLAMRNIAFIDAFVVKYIVWAPAYKMKELILRPELLSIEFFKHYAKFFIILYWSFWAYFGNMMFPLHYLWYMSIAVVQAISLFGVGRMVWRINTGKMRMAQWKCRILYLFAIGIGFAILVPFLRSNVFRFDLVLAQGRYLFPTVIPIAILTVLGLLEVIPKKYYRIAGFLGIIGLIVFDSICLSRYLLLNFHVISLF